MIYPVYIASSLIQSCLFAIALYQRRKWERGCGFQKRRKLTNPRARRIRNLSTKLCWQPGGHVGFQASGCASIGLVEKPMSGCQKTQKIPLSIRTARKVILLRAKGNQKLALLEAYANSLETAATMTLNTTSMCWLRLTRLACAKPSPPKISSNYSA